MTARSLLVLSYFWQGLLADSFYETPQADDQFTNFTITNAIPRTGSTKGGDIQDAVDISPHYIIFEFKGEGNALILFQEDESNETANVCMVEIGGGDLLRRNAVYTSKDLASTPVGHGALSFITSKDEFRPFWIKWLEGRTNIYIGRSLIVGDSQILGTGNAVFFEISAVSISTTSANNGSWRFHAVSTSTTPQSRVTSTEDKTTISTAINTSPDASVATETSSLTSTTLPTSTPTQTEQTTVTSTLMPSTSNDILSSIVPSSFLSNTVSPFVTAISPTSKPKQTEQTAVSSTSMASTSKDKMSSFLTFYTSSSVSNTKASKTESSLVTATSPTSTPTRTEQTVVSSTSMASTSKDIMSSVSPLHTTSTVSNTTESKTESSLVTIKLSSMNATYTTPKILVPTSIPRRRGCVPSHGTVVLSNNNTNPSFIVLFLSWVFWNLK